MRATINLEVTKREVLALSSAVQTEIFELEKRLEITKDPINYAFLDNTIKRYKDLAVTLDELI